MTQIRQLFTDEQPADIVEEDVKPSFIEMARVIAASAWPGASRWWITPIEKAMSKRSVKLMS